MSTQRNSGTPQTPDSTAKAVHRGHAIAAGVIIGTVVVVVAALFTAFVWPGWASRFIPNTVQTSQQSSGTAKKQTKSTATAVPLASDASTLLKAMPDEVGAFARQTVSDSSEWKDSTPIEEHSITYSTGDNDNGTVTLLVAQWASSSDAEKQYQVVLSTLTGKKIAAGAVKVSGQKTGSYELHDTSKANQTVALWRNDTCLFRVTGPSDAVADFYKDFPL